MGNDHSAGMPSAVMFDIDETLITTGGAGSRSWRWAFQTLCAVDVDIAAFTEVGMTDPEVGWRTFLGLFGREPDEWELGRLVGLYLRRLRDEVDASQGYRVLPGVEDLLPALADRGVLLGVTTGNLEAAAHIKLGRGGLSRYFCFGGYGSDSRDRGELTMKGIERAGMLFGHPLDPQRVLVVGDTPRDVDAAHRSNAIAVGVATGHYSQQELRSAGADYVLGTLEEPLPGL